MNQKQTYVALGFLLLAVIGAIFGYRSTRVGEVNPNAKVESHPVSAPSIIKPKVTRLVAADVFDDLIVATRRRDQATIAKLRKGWISSCSRKELDTLIDLVKNEQDTVYRGTMVEAIAGRWAMFAPEAAIDFITKDVHSEKRQAGLHRVFEALAATDPANAFTLIEETSKSSGHPANMQPATEAVFAAWKERDPAAAFSAAGKLAEDALRWSALKALCSAENETERALVFENIRAITEPEHQREAWKHGISDWASQAPFETVIDWIGEQTFEGNLASRLERQAAIEHGGENPKEMAEWLVSRADEDSLPGHLSAAVSFWADDQPNACGEWLHEIGLGPHTDRAVETFSYKIMRHDSQSAFAWAQSIQDESRRSSVLEDISHHFYRFNPKGFLDTVAASQLSETDKNALVDQIKSAAEFR